MATFAVVMTEADEPAHQLINLLMKIKGGDSEEKKSGLESEQKELSTLVEQGNYSGLIQQGLLGNVEHVLEAPPRQIFVVFNLSLSLLLNCDLPEDQAVAITEKFVHALTQSQQHPQVSIRLLSTLFNQLEQTSTLRYIVFLNLLQYSLATEQHESLKDQLLHVDEWIKLWNLDVPQTAQLCLLLAETCEKNCAFKLSNKYLYRYFVNLEDASDALLVSSKPHAAKAAVSAIKSPELITSDTLLGLKAIQQLAEDKTNNYSAIYRLLSIVATGDVSDYLAFANEEKSVFETEDLDNETVLAKMRILTLCSVGMETPEIPYSRLAQLLHVNSDADVEEQVIAAVVSGHIDAKCNQEQEVVTIQRTTARSFKRETWEQLSSKLTLWKDNIRDVLEFLAQVRERKN